MRSGLPRPSEVTGEFGLYVHVPFCLSRCFYCDFNAYAGLDELMPSYMSALASEASWALDSGERPELTSVFVGGGTPTYPPAETLVSVLEAVRDAWPVAAGAEVSVECNPETVDRAKLLAYRQAGVTRLSFGVQSLDDRLLASLGRTHDAATALRAVDMARSAGFDDVNVDLIFGIPGEDDRTWRDTLAGVLAREPTHVSCYGLTYEQDTPLDAWRRLGKVVPEPDDDVARRWETADDVLSAAGLERYEISNWARPGSECRHNMLYWACGEYLGVGAGAHSHIADCQGSTRSWTVKAPAAYARKVAEGRRPVGGSERIDADGRAAEAMFLGLRRTRGVDACAFAALTGQDLASTFGSQLEHMVGAGLMDWDGTRARLTRRGTLLANEAMTAFLAVGADE